MSQARGSELYSQYNSEWPSSGQTAPEYLNNFVAKLGKEDLESFQSFWVPNIYRNYRGNAVYDGLNNLINTRLQSFVPKTEVAPPPPAYDPGKDFNVELQKEVDKRLQSELALQYDKIFGDVLSSGDAMIDEQFADPRRKLLEEEAALGRLDSPVSIVPLSKLDRTRELAKSQFRSGLLSQKAAGLFDMSKAVDTMLSGERRAAEQVYQFQQSFDFLRQKSAEERQQFYDKLLIDKELGLLGKSQTSPTPNKDKTKVGVGYGPFNLQTEI